MAISKEKILELTKRFGGLKEKRQLYEQSWQDVADYCIPGRANFADAVSVDHGKAVDSTAIMSLRTLADGLQGYTVSPQITWLQLVAPTEELNQLHSVREVLQQWERTVYHSLAHSSFYKSASEMIMDAASMGIAVMYCEDDGDDIHFTVRHPKEIYIADSRHGIVDTVFRRYKMTARQMSQQWEEKDLPKRVVEAITSAPDTDFWVIHAVYPRVDGRSGKSIPREKKRYASVYYLDGSNEGISEGGYDEMPYAVWRWTVNSDEIYGRSPAIDALPEILGLNQIAESVIRTAQKHADPPLLASEQLRGRINLRPNGITYWESPEDSLQALNGIGGNFPIAEQIYRQKQQAVRDFFYVDFFLMLAGQNNRAMTALEVSERQAEKVVIMSSVIGSMEVEFLSPIVKRVFHILGRAGKLVEPPEELVGSNDLFDAKYIGPLSQMQKRYYETQGIKSAMVEIGTSLQIFQDPGMLDNFKMDTIVRRLTEKAGLPQDMLQDEKRVAEMRKARAEVQAKQQQMAEMAQLGEATTKLGKGVDANSPLMSMMGGQ